MSAKKIPEKSKKRIIEYVGRQPINCFYAVPNKDILTILPYMYLDIEDIPIEFWESLREVFACMVNGNPTYNKLAYDTVGMIIDEHNFHTRGKVNN